MTTDNLSKIKTRISQLLAMADSTNHPEEAAAFAAKARQLMDEHNLSLGEAVADQNPLGETHDQVPYAQKEYYILASNAARYFGCEALFLGRGEKSFRIFGRESARITTQLMIPYWVKECRRLGNKLSKDTGMPRREAIHSVMDAFSRRLGELTRKDPPKAVHSSLPVPIDEARAMMPDHYDNNTRLRNHAEAAALAKDISVSQQMAGGAAQRRIAG